ncbi:MAG: hypothetical protein HQ453_07760 [Actinobacteria bacterium]|nr:hypothetical protein [Actinomycetota bacterium]
MADDDIERLLREVAGVTGSGTPAPLPTRASTPARVGSAKGRVVFAIGAGVVMGVGGWFVGLVLPFLGAGSMGVGAALGSFVTALVTGAPRWLGRWQ